MLVGSDKVLEKRFDGSGKCWKILEFFVIKSVVTLNSIAVVVCSSYFAVSAVIVSRLFCRLGLCRSAAGISLSAPLSGEVPRSSDLKWQTIKEMPGDRHWNSFELQRSRSERQHHRHNGTSDIAEADGLFEFYVDRHLGQLSLAVPLWVVQCIVGRK